MKIAIVGAGFSGLACAWHLLHMPKELPQITLFDEKGIGGGASGIAAGLMHPFAGEKAMLNWRAREAYEETVTLLRASAMALGEPVASYTGMLRPLVRENMRAFFSKTEASYEDVDWWDGKRAKSYIPELLEIDGLFISSAITVDAEKYLKGLWRACELKGAKLEIAKISSSQELAHFDEKIFAVGAGWKAVEDIETPPLSFIKGQVLELAWEKDRPPLPFSVNAKSYLAMTQSHRCIAGSTFEREWTNPGPDLSACNDFIRHHLSLFSPSFAALPLVECRAQVRAATKQKLPFICHPKENCWCLGGMGSKGLLYHSLMAKELCEELVSNHVV
jgi:glycine/D-amino acid oxidase-like deaminating enzyme